MSRLVKGRAGAGCTRPEPRLPASSFPQRLPFYLACFWSQFVGTFLLAGAASFGPRVSGAGASWCSWGGLARDVFSLGRRFGAGEASQSTCRAPPAAAPPRVSGASVMLSAAVGFQQRPSHIPGGGGGGSYRQTVPAARVPHSLRLPHLSHQLFESLLTVQVLAFFPSSSLQ